MLERYSTIAYDLLENRHGRDRTLAIATGTIQHSFLAAAGVSARRTVTAAIGALFLSRVLTIAHHALVNHDLLVPKCINYRNLASDGGRPRVRDSVANQEPDNLVRRRRRRGSGCLRSNGTVDCFHVFRS